MAVENKYVNADVVAENKAVAAFIGGAAPYFAVVTFETAAADDDLSVYRLLKAVPADYIPIDIKIWHDAITSGTDWDLGLYKTNLGAVLTKDVFLNGADFSSAVLHAAPVDGLTAVDIADVQKRIYEHASDTLATRELGYDICLTANTVGSGVGTISATFMFVQG